jgi:hypothetical protein
MTYTEKLESLYEEVRISIIKNVRLKGSKSNFVIDKTIKGDNERSFNLDYGYRLVEVSEESLIDNEGYLYNFSAISYEDLCAVADLKYKTLNNR